MTKETGGPAFPSGLQEQPDDSVDALHKGMTLRQYAAIKLKVPDSGEDWLDAMITKSLLNDFAANALVNDYTKNDDGDPDYIAQLAYEIANAMLKAGQE